MKEFRRTKFVGILCCKSEKVLYNGDKKGGFVNMKIKKLGILMVLVFMLGITACSANKTDCEELISNLETACNQLDITGILDCVTPSKVAPAKAMVKLAGTGTDKLVSIITELTGVSLSDVTEGIEPKEALASVKFNPTAYDLEEEKGTITCTASFEAAGKTVENTVIFKVVKVDGGWYIDSVSFGE